MKNKKALIGLLIGLGCVLICLVLVLTMCQGSSNQDGPSQPGVTDTTDTTGSDETQGTTPADETTAPVEETTAPVEETTAPTTGNTTPGGSSGGSSGSSSGSGSSDKEEDTATEPTEPVWEASEPGSKGNPYMENITKLPGSFTTVNIPAGGTVYYILQTGGYALVIEDADVSVVLDGKTYNPVNGVVEIPLPQKSDVLMSVQFVNKAAKTKAFSVTVKDVLGTETNPHVLTGINEIKVSLEAGDRDGVYYTWTAQEDGIVKFRAQTVTPADAACDIILSNGYETITLSEEGTDFLTLNVAAGDQVTIQVVAIADEEMTYPAAEVTVAGTTTAFGIESDPITVEPEWNDVATEATTCVTIPANTTVYYTSKTGGMIMSVAAQNISVLYNGNTFTAEEGAISLTLQGNNWNWPVYAFANNTNAEVTCELRYMVEPGTSGNPAQLELGQSSIPFEAGSTEYFLQWTAEQAGTLTVTMADTNVTGWQFVLNNPNGSVYGEWHTSADDPLVSSESIAVNAGDTIDLQVLSYDPENPWTAPAGEIFFTVTFTPAEPEPTEAGIEAREPATEAMEPETETTEPV